MGAGARKSRGQKPAKKVEKKEQASGEGLLGKLGLGGKTEDSQKEPAKKLGNEHKANGQGPATSAVKPVDGLSADEPKQIKVDQTTQKAKPPKEVKNTKK